jgi:hypothetical protein
MPPPPERKQRSDETERWQHDRFGAASDDEEAYPPQVGTPCVCLPGWAWLCVFLAMVTLEESMQGLLIALRVRRMGLTQCTA